MDPISAPAQPVSNEPEERPEVPEATKKAVAAWREKLADLPQRTAALKEFHEANKSLFPARFNLADPFQGQVPQELQVGADTRRVQTPVIYRGTLQIKAMSVPEDLDFTWQAKEQVKPPTQDPMLGQPAVAGDPGVIGFGDTIRIVQRELLGEARWIEKLQAWVQDSDTYPTAILKASFRRDYESASLNPNCPDKDETDGTAAVLSLVQQFAAGEFTKDDAKFAQLQQGMAALSSKARISRWFGLDIQLLALDAWGVMEDVTDLVNIYDTSAMFHVGLFTGEEILKRWPYREEGEGEDMETYGVLASELEKLTPADEVDEDTNRTNNGRSRNKRKSTRRMPGNAAAGDSKSEDRKKLKYRVREIECKRDRTVYVLIDGLDHYVDKFVPQKRSEQWYSYYILSPNRVPGELHGASSVELKRDIQARMHRKRTDEEKARFLHLPRGIYNRSAGVEEKEMLKLSDILPGQIRGINFGTTAQKIDDLVHWLSFAYDPESFSTMKDEQDLDLMGSLPVQAMGQTGSANFATEVNVAANGSAIANNDRRATIQRAIDNFLASTAEVLLQELTVEEVQLIGGPFVVWPTIYDEAEAAAILQEAQQRAMQVATQTVLIQVQQEVMATGVAPDPQAVLAKVQAAAVPIWQSEMMQKYGGIEPMTRSALFQRLKVEVKSSFNSKLDKQQNLQLLSVLAEALMQMGQSAQTNGVPFNPRPIMLHHASLLGGTKIADEAFPAISPMEIAKHLAQQALAQAAAGPNGAPGGAPAPGAETPGNQGPEAAAVDPAQQARNGAASAPNPPIG
jgi:hypothetical protein